MSKVKIIGHRGAANHTENTIPSFASALEQKVDGIELDVGEDRGSRGVRGSTA